MKRVRFNDVCPRCGHDRREHPGGVGGVDDRVCGECLYEVEHGERAPDAPLCDSDADRGLGIDGWSRRQWRAVHKPPVRRGDPIFDLASWVLPCATIGMFFGSTGSSRGRSVPLTEDEAAILVIACAGVILLTLLALSIRLLVRRGRAPLSTAGGVTFVVLSILSMILVLGRGDGEVTPTVIVMFAVNGLCLVVGGVALWLVSIRREVPNSPPSSARNRGRASTDALGDGRMAP